MASKTTYYYKLFRVKRNDGRVTTVSVDPGLVARACQVMGDPTMVSKLVRAAALAYNTGMPEARNCSSYVSSQLRKELEARTKAPAHVAEAPQALAA
jgi:hypothetical protein